MTEKDKAKELFDKYAMYLRSNLMYDEEAREDAKVCALIAVDEIINNLPLISEIQEYWQEVKQEIELL
jgi:hypothetical protein